MDSKPFWQSKTVWFNALALVVLVAEAFGYADFQPSAELPAAATVVVILLNLVLRLVTSQGVRLR